MLAKIPSEAELERQKSFQVHKNYVCAAIDCISDVHGTLDPANLLEAQRNLPCFADRAWPRFLKLLETTRKQALTARCGQWCVQKVRKKTLAHEKSTIAAKVGATTLFDVFWRLRVRENYKDAESFVMVTGVPAWHRQFHDALIALMDLRAYPCRN